MRTDEVAYWNVQMMKRWRKSPAALEASDLEAFWDAGPMGSTRRRQTRCP